MRRVPFAWHRRFQGTHIAIRHVLMLAVLGILLAGLVFCSRLPGVFARVSCATGDQVYTVISGDNLATIAARYDTTWWRMANYNHLSNASLIFPSETLCIPSSTQGSGMNSTNMQYTALARQDALNVGIPPETYVRQILQESGFNPGAVSPAGAIGIAQFEPATAAALGVDPRDPVASLKAAAQLMANYARQYGGDYAKALAAYNAGPGTVQAAVQQGGVNWRNFLPLETQNYIRVILG